MLKSPRSSPLYMTLPALRHGWGRPSNVWSRPLPRGSTGIDENHVLVAPTASEDESCAYLHTGRKSQSVDRVSVTIVIDWTPMRLGGSCEHGSPTTSCTLFVQAIGMGG